MKSSVLDVSEHRGQPHRWLVCFTGNCSKSPCIGQVMVTGVWLLTYSTLSYRYLSPCIVFAFFVKSCLVCRLALSATLFPHRGQPHRWLVCLTGRWLKSPWIGHVITTGVCVLMYSTLSYRYLSPCIVFAFWIKVSFDIAESPKRKYIYTGHRSNWSRLDINSL